MKVGHLILETRPKSEPEHFHMQDAFDQLGSDYNSNVCPTKKKKNAPPPRSKNRSITQICLSKEHIPEPPSIHI